MLTITQEQMAVFREPAIEGYVKRTAVHLKELFPEDFAAMGEHKLDETIRQGIQRAASYGFILQGDVRRYLELSVRLGADFDSDPQFPWASSILNDESIEDAATKIDRLYFAAENQPSAGATSDGRR